MTDYSALIIPGNPMRGRISEFAGPFDLDVALTEGLALYTEELAAKEPSLFKSSAEVKAQIVNYLAQPGINAPFRAKLAAHYAPALAETDPVQIGLAHCLDPKLPYCAMRWNYKVTPKNILRRAFVQISPVKISPGGKTLVIARPFDWGPAESTRRLIDVSHSVLQDLALKTDDEVYVTLHLPYDQAV
jgi:hypothetical protein